MSSSAAAAAPPENTPQNPPNTDITPQDPPATGTDNTNTDADGDLEAEKKLALDMARVIEHALEQIKPMLKFISAEVDKANKTDKEDLDEQALVDKLKPMIEECSRSLNQCLGTIKGMDPDGKLANKAQRNYADHNATPEEQRLAKALAELTGEVTKVIEDAKEKIKDMPKAGPQLAALLGLLQDPLFQILSAVGLLLNGVLMLVGNLLDGLGLGGIVRGVLAGLGLDKVLKALGLGKLFEKKDKDAK